MRRLITLFVVVLLVGTGCVRAETLRVGIDNVEIRYSEIDTHIQDNDIELALLELLNQGLQQTKAPINGFRLRSVSSDPDAKNRLLLEKNVDAIFTEATSATLPEGVVESLPLFSSHWRIVSLKDRVNLKNSFQDLNGKHIIAVDSLPAEALKQRYPHAVLTIASSLDDAIKLLKAGSADGVLCRQQVATVLSENIFSGQLVTYPFDTLITQTRLRLRKDNLVALSALNQAIVQLPTERVNDILSRNLTMLTLVSIVPQLKRDHNDFDTAAVLVGVLALFLIATLIQQNLHRRKVKLRLLDAIKFWETLLNSLSTPVLVCNSAGMITHVNQALCKSLDVAATTVIGTAVERFNQQYFSSPALDTAGLVQASLARQAQFFEGHYTLHGSQHSIAGWITPYSNTHLVQQGLVIGWYDMSERIRLEEKLEQALAEANAYSHEKSDFLARMSHEIRSPMSVIMGVLEIENQRNHAANSPISIAYSASRSLLKIIGDILDLSKIEAGEMKLKPTPVSLYALLENAANAYQSLAQRKGLRLDSDIESCFGQDYLLDEGKTVQIINNLLSNAIKYTQHGHVALAVKVADAGKNRHRLTLSVSDSGIGIDSALLASIIKPYQQISSSTPDSTGLGLTICHQLTTLMGGELDIRSQQNIGSTFTVTLCCERVAPDKVPTAYPAASSGSRRYSIWVIDDLPANLLIMEMQLSVLGHDVSRFNSARNALEQLQDPDTAQPDIILTDCQMPEMSGYAFATQVRLLESSTQQHLPIVGCTANAFSDEELKCLSAGMDGQLTKPITQEDLKNCLYELLFSRQLDLSEMLALASGQHQVMEKLVDELQKSSAEDLMLIEHAWQAQNIEVMNSKIHRLKGSFALTGFEAGQNLCLTLERKLAHGDRDIATSLLHLRHTTQHFIAMLHPFHPS